LQGITEWIPVSSDGSVSAVYSVLKGGSLDEALAYAQWLHLGTVPAAIIVLRREVVGLVREVGYISLRRWNFSRGGVATELKRPSPLFMFLVISTIVSGLVGLPLLIALDETLNVAGPALMVVIGLFLLVTGYVLLKQRVTGSRTRDELSGMDAVLAGVMQGLAALPGISRSGMTMSIMLARRIDRQEALIASFLMSIPASLGGAFYGALDSDFNITTGHWVGAAAAFVVGLVCIKGLLAVAGRVNFGGFVLAVGALMVVGGVVEAAVG
jgi:undecaprenyl-diphosphatase